MKALKWVGIIIGAILLLSIGAALGGAGEDPEPTKTASRPAAPSSTAAPEETETEAPPTREVPNPDGRYEMDCDYSLPADIDSQDYKFIAGGTLENTGNVGIVARVTYKWDLLGQSDYKQVKTYRIARGRERDVDVSFPITSDLIDAHQSADSDCDVKVRISDTFGRPPLEP